MKDVFDGPCPTLPVWESIINSPSKFDHLAVMLKRHLNYNDKEFNCLLQILPKMAPISFFNLKNGNSHLAEMRARILSTDDCKLISNEELIASGVDKKWFEIDMTYWRQKLKT